MKYYIACDGGGSKLEGLLYDEDLNVIRTARQGGVNVLFMDEDAAWNNIVTLMDELTDGGRYKVERVDACIVGNSREMMDKFVALPLGKIRVHRESRMALSASLMRYGGVALSGTGSDAFVVYDDDTQTTVGGYGALFGDEGSGYDIGLRTVKAAMYSDDGRGEKTLLEELVYEHFGTRDFFRIVTDFSKDTDARRRIAAVSKLTSRAAGMGDPVAIGIYEYAGHEMAHQLCTAIARDEARWNGTVTIVGGAWKGSPVMYEVFCRDVLAKYPTAKITKPLFEPLIGCIVKRLYEEGCCVEALRPRLLEAFANYTYKL